MEEDEKYKGYIIKQKNWTKERSIGNKNMIEDIKEVIHTVPNIKN